MTPPRVLLLGGLDPSGGAGLTVDATVVALHGASPLPVALALTEQGRAAFRRSHAVAADVWRGALRAVLADGPVHAVKVGLLADVATLRTLASELAALAPAVPVVVDPVLSATAGGYSPPAELAAAYREHLLPRATLFTPNVPELAAVCAGDAQQALAAGARAVLVKGGHADGPQCTDTLCTARDRVVFARERLPVGPVRGTGCALASAIACHLAVGATLADACREAGDWLGQVLRTMGPPDPDGLPRPLPLARVPPRPAR